MSLMISVAVVTVGSLLTALSPSLGWLVLWRFVTGLSSGAEIASVSSYLGEASPARLRGRYTSCAATAGFVGLAATPLIALLLVSNFSWDLERSARR